MSPPAHAPCQVGLWADTVRVPPAPKHQGSARLLHHSLLITLHKERPLLVPGPPGTATRGAGWPIKSSVGLVVPPHPSCLLGSSSWSVHFIPAALSVLALQRPISIHLSSSPPPRLSFACSVLWESRFGLLQHQAERRQGKSHWLIIVLTPI